MLIIGIIVAGITQSSRLISAFRLSSAKSQTQSSPVNSIKDLAVWYETSSDASFIATEADNNTKISYWYDINPQSTTKNHASQGTSGNQPKYYTNAMNGLPVIRFDGSATYLGWDGTILAVTNYTIFVVEQRTATGAQYNHIIGGSSTTVNTNFQFGYYTSAPTYNFHVAHYGVYTSYTELYYAIGNYTTTTPRIHTARLEGGVKSEYWLNGGTTPENSGVTYSQLASNAGSTVGRDTGNGGYYTGDLAEIIIFTRALKTEERQAIETYLAKKYNITIS